MQTFLEDIVKDLLQRFNGQLDQLCLVFPNRRASLFFLKHLKENSEKAIWAPNTTTINEFFEALSPLHSTDKLQLLFELFDVYKEVYNPEETFDTFYFWGGMILRDFDEIDKYQVNAEILYQNLLEEKEIEYQFNVTDEQLEAIKSFWRAYNDQESIHKEQFLSVWEKLFPIYQQFKSKLTDLSYAYDGMIYRDVAERAKNKQLNYRYDQYVFIGFNALNKCEKDLFSILQEEGKAMFYWDVDDYYISDKSQEAGFFMRDNIKDYPMPKGFEVKSQFLENYKTQSTNFDLVAINGEIGQTQIIGELLDEQWSSVKEEENVAIVLPDEHMLLPLLHTIPESVQKINVSMGYPVKETPLYALFEHIIEMQRQLRNANEGVKFRSKDVLNILRHAYILFQEADQIKPIIQSIKHSNQLWVNKDDLLKDLPQLDWLFLSVATPEAMFTYCLEVAYFLYDSLKGEDGVTLEQEYVYHFYTQINRLKDLLEGREGLSMKMMLKLFQQFLSDLRVPFNGEPLEGLQVMGVLETRCLDFDHLYLMSMNEGSLPANSVDSSFIPYHLRRGFGLPTIEEYDAVYAYYFYRLIQRANKITLLYNNASDGDLKAQVSRFVHQLKYELPGDHLKERVIENELYVDADESIAVKKTDEIIHQLQQFEVKEDGTCDRPLSPTAISTYLKCSLQFYFKYLLGIKEPEEIEEEVDALTFGNLLHRSMELLYLPYVGQEIGTCDLGIIQSNSRDVIKQAIEEEFEKEVLEEKGQLLIVEKVLQEYVDGILRMDEDYIPFKVNGLELNVGKDIAFQGRSIRILGNIDRVDEKNGEVRIIDYKTGVVNTKIKSIEGLFSKDSSQQNSYALQALMYAYLYRQQKNDGKEVVPSLLAVKEISQHPSISTFELQVEKDPEKGITKSFYQDFGSMHDDHSSKYIEGVKSWMSDLYDQDSLFEQTEDHRTCEFCPYIGICRRNQ